MKKFNIVIKNRSIVIFSIILILTIFLRFWRLEEIPYYQTGNFLGDVISFSTYAPSGLFDYYTYMHTEYKASGFHYLTYPLKFLTPGSLLYYRIVTAFFDVLAVIFLFLFLWDFLGERYAIVGSLIYAIFPNAINWARTGIDVSLLSFSLCVTLFLFYRWYKTKNKKYLYIGSFLAGYGISIHIAFVYAVMSYIILALILFLHHKKFRKRLLNKQIVIVIFFFSMGLFPYIIGNLLWNFATINSITKNLSVQTWGSNNLKLRFEQFNWITGDLHHETFYPILKTFNFTFLILLLSSIYIIYKRDNKGLFLTLLLIFSFFLSIFTIGVAGKTHIIFLIPLTVMIISRIADNRIFLVLLLYLVIFCIILTGNYMRQYTGDEYGYKALIKYLKVNKPEHVVTSIDATQVVIDYFYGNTVYTEKYSLESCIIYVTEHSDTLCILDGIIDIDKKTNEFISNNHLHLKIIKTITVSDPTHGITYIVVGAEK